MQPMHEDLQILIYIVIQQIKISWMHVSNRRF
jgi:hypothetical protein